MGLRGYSKLRNDNWVNLINIPKIASPAMRASQLNESISEVDFIINHVIKYVTVNELRNIAL
jgi:hypothetical protein